MSVEFAGRSGSVAARLPRRSRSATLRLRRQRRLLLSTWRRLTRWEFWPPWAFYPPVVAYLVFLMVKHRSATLFTAANPGMPAGGFVGESKFDILRRLSASAGRVAAAELLPGHLGLATKLDRATAFMTAHAIGFPVVLKPDQGQRGSGVVVVRSAAMLADCLARSTADTIIQEYAPGAEFGVFYYRRPSEPRGHIFSVTEKRFPTVHGDGRGTLEELILGDDRAVCMARFHLDRHRERLQDVPPAGERVELVELGTHCRGAEFVDGEAVLTPALEDAFDEVSRGFDGFCFGRFDVRTPLVEDFRMGRNFKIVELNGVTSEATHIYDPATSLWAAYRVLFEQWRIAFEIGAENRRLGFEPTPVKELVRLVRDYRRTARLHLRSPVVSGGPDASWGPSPAGAAPTVPD